MEIFKYIVLSFLMAVITFVLYTTTDSSKISNIENATGIDLPPRLSSIDVYDSGKFYTIAHVLLSKDKIEKFITTNNFISVEYCNQRCLTVKECKALREKCLGHKKPRQMPGINHLRKGNQFAKENADLYFLYGNSPKNKWEFLIDRLSGDLWVAVFSTDKPHHQGMPDIM
jgi:hypothetical protein